MSKRKRNRKQKRNNTTVIKNTVSDGYMKENETEDAINDKLASDEGIVEDTDKDSAGVGISDIATKSDEISEELSSVETSDEDEGLNKNHKSWFKRKKENIEGIKNIDVMSKDEHSDIHDDMYKSSKKSVLQQYRDAMQEYDDMVKEDIGDVVKNEEGSPVLKGLCIAFGVLILVTILGIIFISRGNAISKDYKVECCAESVYQYDKVEAKDFVYKTPIGISYRLDKLPSDVKYSILTESYYDSYVSIKVNNHVYSVSCPYVACDDITWSYKGNQEITKKELDGLSEKDIIGCIEYKDGTKKELSADSIVVDKIEGVTVICAYVGDRCYQWFPIVVEDSTEKEGINE